MIPTEISITDSEISSDIRPTPYYVSFQKNDVLFHVPFQALLPRMSYFAFAAADAIDYFKPYGWCLVALYKGCPDSMQ